MLGYQKLCVCVSEERKREQKTRRREILIGARRPATTPSDGIHFCCILQNKVVSLVAKSISLISGVSEGPGSVWENRESGLRKAHGSVQHGCLEIC